MGNTQRNQEFVRAFCFFFFYYCFLLRFVCCSKQTYSLQNMLFKSSNFNNNWKVETIKDETEQVGTMNDDLIPNGLPGQPSSLNFRQYSGYVTVDIYKGRRLFYYFVEVADRKPTTDPLILWLNGGPGCSSLGIGAMIEHGPFGANPDGNTLYLRKNSWNQVANILYLESPAGVGFSYSDTASDYNTTGDPRTARDSYVFLMNWFQRFPQYIGVDFYIAGESYGGLSVPQLADTILHNQPARHTSSIKLKGVIVGNGFLNEETDYLGIYDFFYSHALISTGTHKGLVENCAIQWTVDCRSFLTEAHFEMEHVVIENLYSEPCSSPSSTNKSKLEGSVDPCEEEYVINYLNNVEVQHALHVDSGDMPFTWAICRLFFPWKNSTKSVFPIYEKLISLGIRALLYSGDVDGIIPFTSTVYSLEAMNLTVKQPWRPWFDDNKKIGGSRVEYNGLTFATVRGAGHEVPRYEPERALSLLRWFLEEQ